EIFEDRLIDCSAVKFQNYAIKPINIDHKTGLIVRLKRYRGGNGWRYSYHALLHETAAIFHPSARVLQSRFIESLLHRRLTAERNFNRQRFGSDDFIIDVDFIDHGKADNPPLMLADVGASQARRSEEHTSELQSLA